MWHAFLCCLLPCEDKLAAVQMDFGWVWDPEYHYCLDITNIVPIQAKPTHLNPEEEAWLHFHLAKLIAKGVIGPILLGKQPQCVVPLLLVLDVQSGQPYWVCQNIVPVNKWIAEYQ